VLVVPALCLALALGLLGCAQSHEQPPPEGPEQSGGPAWFEDVTAAVGLNFVHDPGPTGTYFMPQSMGSGCAFLDFDGDGHLDIYLVQQGGPKGKKNQLFKQLPDGTFKDVSKGSGLDVAEYGCGVAVGDVNNDGKPDVLLTYYGGIKLFLNNGDGTFSDITQEAGLHNPLWGASAAFFDYDRDGWLDLVVVNYIAYDPKRECATPEGLRDFCGPNQFRGTCSKLFRNLGGAAKPADGKAPRARFADVSFASGVGRLEGPGLGVVCADFTGDGWPDILVANDGKPNRLWVNQKDGTFKDDAISRGLAYTVMGQAYANMGIAVGDVSGGGMLDVFVTHLGGETHTLWRQGPRGTFRDQTGKAGLIGSPRHGTGFGTLLADFDLDGTLDLAVVNGRVFRGGPARGTKLGFWETFAERNQLFANDGTGKFREVSAANPAFCGYWNVGRGLACADFNSDGAPDLLVTAVGERARLFKNVAPKRGHWLKVRALEWQGQRDAYGAEVRVRAGGRTWLRLVNPAESYLSSGSPLAHFGLGQADRVEAIEVTWPDGTRETFAGGAADRPVELRQGKGHAP
jgi:hypothetical protein